MVKGYISIWSWFKEPCHYRLLLFVFWGLRSYSQYFKSDLEKALWSHLALFRLAGTRSIVYAEVPSGIMHPLWNKNKASSFVEQDNWSTFTYFCLFILITNKWKHVVKPKEFRILANKLSCASSRIERVPPLNIRAQLLNMLSQNFMQRTKFGYLKSNLPPGGELNYSILLR
jgi:hypothetical protein